MVIQILILAVLVVVATIASVSLWQLKLVRKNLVVINPTGEVSLGELLQRQIDRWYWGFSFFFQQLVHVIYYYFLLLVRRSVIIVRYFSVRAERKSSRLIDSVRGKGVIHKRGAVSLFLTRIKESR